ncbi:hypothetical protein CPC08DRAFT_208407 [Agrocybe pediades]|nr:hypothetical protein CPC08DRAFT_208407 [Agrocybe pediades]
MLWITGRICHTSLRSFLTTLLREKWANVQIFDIAVYENGAQALVEIWPMLQTKAPNLETFRIEAYCSPTLPSFPPIFDDEAPRLRQFQAGCMESRIPFGPVAPWLSNLSSISFSRTHTVSFIFSALKSAPLLEMIVIDGDEPLPLEDADAISIQLPRLKLLRIHGRHFTEVYSLLRHIKPPSSPGLFITKIQGVGTGASVDIEKTNTILVQWVSAFINNHRPTSIIFHHRHYSSTNPLESTNVLIISVKAKASPEDPDRIPFFLAEIDIDHPSGYSALRALATTPSLSFIQCVTLVGMLPESVKELVSLFQAFSGVTEVAIDRCRHDTIQAFQPVYDSPSLQPQGPIFPLLHTVQVRMWVNFSMSVDYMFDFLEYRARIGSPVLLLDLGECFNEEFTEDQKGRLRQIDGLVIRSPKRC